MSNELIETKMSRIRPWPTLTSRILTTRPLHDDAPGTNSDKQELGEAYNSPYHDPDVFGCFPDRGL